MDQENEDLSSCCLKAMATLNEIGNVVDELIFELNEMSQVKGIILEDLTPNDINTVFLDKLAKEVYKIHATLYASLHNDLLPKIKDDSNLAVGKFLKLEKCMNNIFKEKFSMKPSFELSPTNSNSKQSCIVINMLKDIEEFFVYDLQNIPDYRVFFQKMKYYFSTSLIKKENLPKLGEIFGVILNNKFLRAVRENTLFISDFYECYLLDHGKTLTLKINDQTYILPADIQEIPPLAVRCKLNVITSTSNKTTIQTFFAGDHDKSRKYNFQVSKMENGIWYLNLEENLNPFTSYLNDEEKSWLNIEDQIEIGSEEVKNDLNCLREENNNLDIQINNLNISKENEENYTNINKTNVMMLNKFHEINDLKTKDEDIATSNLKLTSNELSEKDRAMLFDEPLNTSNALKAVMGYQPRDDARICAFAREGECFKGSRCRLNHDKKLSTGWTRDEDEVFIENRNSFPIPPVGSIISIKPSVLESPGTFFAQINSQTVHQSDPSLGELTRKWNAVEEIAKYKKYGNHIPVCAELVLAKYTDGYFYRAKIMDVVDDDNVLVIYLDYGNKYVVSVKDLRKWDLRFEEIPFQAVHFTFDGVMCSRDKENDVISYLQKNFLNSSFNAKVINNFESIYVKVYDRIQNIDITDELIKKGYFVKIVNSYPINLNQILPG